MSSGSQGQSDDLDPSKDSLLESTLPPTPTSTPSKKKLLEFIPRMAPHWYEIGLQLLNDNQEPHLDVIKLNCSNDYKQCCLKMLWYWLETNPKASWQQLTDSLRSPVLELNTVAASIEAMFTERLHINQQQLLKKEEAVISFDVTQFKSIRAAFIHLTSNISKLLQNGDFYAIRRSCIEQIHTPSGAQLSPDMVKDIKTAKNLNVLLDTLADSPYWSWIDLRLLEAMVVASGSSAANNLLASYQSSVFSMKLVEVLPSVPNVKVKDEYYSKIVSKIEKNIEEITVSDLLEFRSQLETVIMDIKTGTCALAHIEEGCIEIQWLIPTNCINHAYKSACLNRDKFHLLHLQYLQIEAYKIYSSSVLHPSQSTPVELQLPKSAATCKDLIDHFSHYLTTEMDSDVLVNHMLSQHLLNDQEVVVIMSAASLYQKNCLVLEKIRQMDTKCLVSFCEILQLFDYQKHIASILSNALSSFGFLSSIAISQSAQSESVPSNSTSQHVLPADIKSGDKSRKRSAHSDQPARKKYFKASAVEAEFLDMKMQLEQLVKTSSPEKVFEQCKSLMASHEPDIALFSNKQLNGLKECKLVPEILQRLSSYFKWSDHSVLHELVKACDNPEAEMLLHQFDSQVDLFLPITEYPIPQPIPSMAPYDTSTQTILAIKLDTELSTISLEQVIELQCLIQNALKITNHCLQLTATKKSSAILYWMIPKCISHLITKLMQHDSSFFDQRIIEICVYPGTLFVSANSLQLGSLSFINQINDLISRDEKEIWSVELSNLEQLPEMISKLRLELKKREFTKESIKETQQDVKQIMVQVQRDDQLDQVNTQNERLQIQLKESKTHEKVLQQQINRADEKYSHLNEMYEKLEAFTSVKEVDYQLDQMQRKIMNLKSAFETIDVVEIFTKKQTNYKRGAVSKDEGIIVGHFQIVNRELDTLEEWSKLLQENLADKTKKINNLQEEVKLLSKKLSDYKSELMVKDRELQTLQEDNKLLVKQFRQKKEAQKKREMFSQEEIMKKEILGSGQFGTVRKISSSKQLFAGKSIYPTLVPGYPNSSSDQLKQFTKNIDNKVATYSYFAHSNIELFETTIQLSNESIPTILSELYPENLDMFTTRMKGNLSIYQQLEMCNEMAKGIQYLHEAGIIHTNLHGRNVLVSHDGHAKIGDYICSQMIFSEEIPINNIAYLPPEAITDKSQCNEQSDVYSLGTLFLQITTQNIPEPTDKTQLSKLTKRREELACIKHHPLFSLVHRCLTNFKVTRPSITKVLEYIATAEESPQSIIAYSLYYQESLEFGHTLQNKRYKLQWTSCTKLPTAMWGAQATVINSILYVTGGWCPKDRRKIYTVYKYELDKDQWSVLPPLQQSYGVPVSVNNHLTIIGGKDGHNKTINWVVTFSDNRWKNIYPNLSVARSEPAVVPYLQYIIVAGGQGYNDNVLDSIEVFNFTTSHWIIIGTHLPKPMYCISATMCADSIIIVGYSGVDYKRYNGTFMIAVDDIVSKHQPTQESLTSSTDDNNTQWHKLPVAPYWRTVLVPNTSLPVIIGGEDKQGNTVNNITLYDDTSNGWKKISTIPINCAKVTVAVINQSIIVMGGCRDTKTAETIDATALSDVSIGQLILCD